MERFNSKKNSYDANQDKIGQRYGNKITFAILCILCMAINFFTNPRGVNFNNYAIIMNNFYLI